jgi:hypothetical protein
MVAFAIAPFLLGRPRTVLGLSHGYLLLAWPVTLPLLAWKWARSKVSEPFRQNEFVNRIQIGRAPCPGMPEREFSEMCLTRPAQQGPAASALTVGGTTVGTATTLARGDHKHTLPAFGTTVGTFCQGNDARLSDDRTTSGLRSAGDAIAAGDADAEESERIADLVAEIVIRDDTFERSVQAALGELRNRRARNLENTRAVENGAEDPPPVEEPSLYDLME